MKRILLLDDNIYEYKKAIDILRSQYDVSASSYIQTIRHKLMNSIDYDLIVLDIMIPTLGLFDSEETSDGLRTGLVFYEKEIKPLQIPVLFWSWNTDFEEEIKRKKWADTDFLLKQDDDDHLLNGVNRFLERLK